MNLGPIVVNYSPHGAGSNWAIAHDIYPRPLFQLEFDHRGGTGTLHWYIWEASPFLAIGGQEEPEEKLCSGIPSLDLMICADSGQLQAIEFMLPQDGLSELEQIDFPEPAEFQTPQFDLQPWDIRKSRATKIRACRAPLRIGVTGDRLTVFWFPRAQRVEWLAVNNKLRLAFTESQELVAISLADVNAPEIRRINNEL